MSVADVDAGMFAESICMQIHALYAEMLADDSGGTTDRVGMYIPVPEGDEHLVDDALPIVRALPIVARAEYIRQSPALDESERLSGMPSAIAVTCRPGGVS